MASVLSSIDRTLDASALWFLRSGIQEASGGVARYHRIDEGRNAAVSTEITGYAVSALVWMHGRSGHDCMPAARRAARFLVRDAWDSERRLMPFELDGERSLSYFFDCGIIARGLLHLWRATADQLWLDASEAIGRTMLNDFYSGEDAHPVIRLEDRQPLPREARWSRQSGCYQLKSALAWRELFDATGDTEFRDAYERMLAWSLRNHEAFLPGETDERRVMDRLHAYSYFLEALFPVLDRPEARAAISSGIERTGALLREISPRFQRSDVCAQLLRARLGSEALAGMTLDFGAASEEAEWAGSYQSTETSLEKLGGFWFGRSEGAILSFMNPVSTAFCAQALEWWRERQQNHLRIAPQDVI